MSPDGALLAFTAWPTRGTTATRVSTLYVRRLDQLHATAIAGAEGALSPFFSPDGGSVAFFTNSQLEKVVLSTGAIATLCEAPLSKGGVWHTDGTIVFQSAGTTWSTSPLLRVSESGGQPVPVVPSASDGLAERWPQILPGGAVLSTVPSQAVQVSFDVGNIVVRSLPSGARKILGEGYFARYVSSGHLLWVRDSTLFAAPFDANRLAIVGPTVPVVEGIDGNAVTGAALYTVSDAGALAFVAGRGTLEKSVDWLERSGKTSP